MTRVEKLKIKLAGLEARKLALEEILKGDPAINILEGYVGAKLVDDIYLSYLYDIIIQMVLKKYFRFHVHIPS